MHNKLIHKTAVHTAIMCTDNKYCFFLIWRFSALEKKGGGIRPITVGCTLRRLVAKVASGKMMVEMATPTWLCMELARELKRQSMQRDSTSETLDPAKYY